MGFTFNRADSRALPVTLDDIEVEAEDICCLVEGITVNDHGDLAVVRREKAAYQSVVREGVANPGSFPRRPSWGAGLPGLLFKGATSGTRDRMISRMKSRMFENPRLVKVHEVAVTNEEDGARIQVRADSISGLVDVQYVVKPPGVR